MECAGYMVVTLVLQLADHGLNVLRKRIWFLCRLMPNATKQRRVEAQEKANQVEFMLRQDPLPVERCLLDIQDPLHIAYMKAIYFMLTARTSRRSHRILRILGHI